MAALLDPDDLQAHLGLAGNAVYPATAYEQVADAASDLVSEFLAVGVENTTPAVREATLAVAVELWQARLAPGGQMNAVDWTPGPFRLGRSLIGRVSGLLGPYLDTGSVVG